MKKNLNKRHHQLPVGQSMMPPARMQHNLYNLIKSDIGKALKTIRKKQPHENNSHLINKVPPHFTR